MFDRVLAYFAADPLKLLYLIGGSGGLWYWLSLWRERRRVVVRLLSETYDLAEEPNCDVTLEVEITNVGDAATALEPYVPVTGVNPKRDKRSFVLEVTERDRSLRPHEPKRFRCCGRCGAEFAFLWYKTYTFSLTRGSTARIRIQSARGNALTTVRYYIGKLCFYLGWPRAYET